MAAIKYWLWLSGLDISSKAKAALIRHYGEPEAVFFAPDAELYDIPGITKAEARLLIRRELAAAERALGECEKMGIDIITMQDASYPKRLRHIPDAPVVLYVRGKLPDVDNCPTIAVIGTRKPSVYGLKMGRNISYEIARSGAIVISMLSEGLDRECARAALTAGGCCIGVLGTAHSRENALYRDIVTYGALISEYPPGTEPKKHFFRERNRVAAGLCHGVTVVEAPETSGTLLFAARALEQGREVFAVPGNADSFNSVGTNGLIKQGAKPVTRGWDVLEDFEYLFPGKLKKPAAEETAPEHPAEKPQDAHDSTVKDIDKPAAPVYIGLREQLSELNAEQLEIISAIEGDDTHIDELIERTGMSTAKVLAQLTILEIKGYVRRSAGRRISLNIKSK